MSSRDMCVCVCLRGAWGVCVCSVVHVPPAAVQGSLQRSCDSAGLPFSRAVVTSLRTIQPVAPPMTAGLFLPLVFLIPRHRKLDARHTSLLMREILLKGRKGGGSYGRERVTFRREGEGEGQKEEEKKESFWWKGSSW